MNKIKSTFSVLAASVVLSVPASAVITWQTNTALIAGGNVETFVDNTGDFELGYNANGASGVDATVNGVLFTTSVSGSTVTGPGGVTALLNTQAANDNNTGAFGDGAFSGNGSIFDLLRGASFDLNSVTLGGLTIGQEYLIQIFTHDGRANRGTDLDSRAGFGDGTGSTEAVGISGLSDAAIDSNAGGTGFSVIGTFTATQETLTFNVFGSTNGSNPAASPTGAGQINALQVRSIPEPSSTALLGLGGLALLLRRKK